MQYEDEDEVQYLRVKRVQTGSSGVEARVRSLCMQQCGEDDGGYFFVGKKSPLC